MSDRKAAGKAAAQKGSKPASLVKKSGTASRKPGTVLPHAADVANNGTVIMTCGGCALFSYMPEDSKDFLYRNCKLVAMLAEKIHDLKSPVSMLHTN